MSDEKESKHGVQSLEVGAGVLRAVVNGHRAMMLKEIAAAADIPPSKAHRYLVSLIRSGLIEQDPATSRYSLGPFALNIGLVAIDRLDRIRLGMAAISELRDEINETTAIAVWPRHRSVGAPTATHYRQRGDRYILALVEYCQWSCFCCVVARSPDRSPDCQRIA